VKEDICSIPVNEVLEIKDGCPICRMHGTVEEHLLDFIMGAAMMEPDVRVETNRVGFCGRHFMMMLGRKNRLALALMLESRLKSVEETVFQKDSLLFKKEKAGKAEHAAGDCYVCSHLETALDGHINTFFKLWKKEPEFRANVAAQPIICLPHYILLLRKGQAALDKKGFDGFESAISDVMRSGLLSLEKDVTGFCRMYDYQNGAAEWGNKKDAPERAIAYLTGFKKQ
jgi:hypothetical protein